MSNPTSIELSQAIKSLCEKLQRCKTWGSALSAFSQFRSTYWHHLDGTSKLWVIEVYSQVIGRLLRRINISKEDMNRIIVSMRLDDAVAGSYTTFEQTHYDGNADALMDVLADDYNGSKPIE